MKINNFIKNHLEESIKVKKQVVEKNLKEIVMAAEAMIETYWRHGGTVYLFGNGGSSCDAQHFAEELTSAFKNINRWSLPAHALSDNGAVITAIANDFGFDYVFARQLEGVAKPGDLVIAISTSGNSTNIIKAVEVARKRGIKTIGLLGKGGGRLVKMVDIPIVVPSNSTAHIQESHMAIAHAICGLVEEIFFDDKNA